MIHRVRTHHYYLPCESCGDVVETHDLDDMGWCNLCAAIETKLATGRDFDVKLATEDFQLALHDNNDIYL